MSSLVPPHGADSLKPLLLPEPEREKVASYAMRFKAGPLVKPRGLRSLNARYGCLHAAHRFYG